MKQKFEPKNCYERICKKSLNEKELFEAKNNLLGYLELLYEINKQTQVVKFDEIDNEHINNSARKEKSNEKQK